MRSTKRTGPNGDEFQLIDKHMPSLYRILKKKKKYLSIRDVNLKKLK